ncbi:MAG: DUF411 domain-containing protein [Woeseia sp.]
MNMITDLKKVLVTALLALPVSACAEPPGEQEDASGAEAARQHDLSGAAAHSDTTFARHLLVNKTPWCGCCTLWAEQAEEAGFDVEMRELDDLAPVKDALGVPATHASCHTAEIGGYVIEGHVPFDDIKRLLKDAPDARGLVVPGMPIGSPGMEQGERRQAYDVYLIDNDGNTSVYSHHPAR